MRVRTSCLAVVGAFLPMHVTAQPPCTDLIGNGSIGVYADAGGTQQCITANPGPPATLHVIAKLAGASAQGITGAEFRIEVAQLDGSAPTRWFMIWSINPAAGQTSIGNPIDPTPQDPTDAQGINLVFPTCQPDPLTAQVSLGTITLINDGGAPFTMRVKRKSPPSSPNFASPHFILCDAPVFTRVPITPDDSELGREGVASVSQVNVPQCPKCTPPPITAPLGIYADSLGATTLCVQDTDPTMLHLIGIVPSTQPAGVTGAEFRIEVANPAGYFFSYLPPVGASVFGSPFDLTPNDPNDATGTSVFFPQCRPSAIPSPGDLINFGRIVVVNLGSGGTTSIHVRRKNPPGDPGQPCPRFFMCDAPFNTPICMSGMETVYSNTLNPVSCLPAPFTPETLQLDTHAIGDDGDAGPVSTAQVMDHRKQFLITVVGNLSMWPAASWIAPPNVLCGVPDRNVSTQSPGVTNYWAGADAMVTFAVPLPPGGDCNNLEGLGYPRNPGLFQMDLGSGFTSPMPLGGLIANPSPGHLYKFLVTGDDAVGSFRWLEAITSDNYGVLTIIVEEAHPSDVTVAAPQSRIRVLGNVPDPFNPTTRVRYELPAATEVTVQVFDVRSRLVRSLFRGLQHPGVREIEWDGRSTAGLPLPSGCYFVRIESPQGTGVERVTLVR